MNHGPALRFDDILDTVMAADLGSPQATQSAWRQLVDLVGRRRAAPDAGAMAKLRAIRDDVPLAVRAASARALEFADPPSSLVRLFATDDFLVALPVLRSARMHSSDWIQLLPDLAPAARGVLRNRRDLGPTVERALAAFGPIDFVLADETAKDRPEVLGETRAPTPDAPTVTYWPGPSIVRRAAPAAIPAQTVQITHARAPGLGDVEDFSFVALADSAVVLPASAPDSIDRSASAAAAIQSGPIGAIEPREATVPAHAHGPAIARVDGREAQSSVVARKAPLQGPPADLGDDAGTFAIADVVKRIDAFWRHRAESGPVEPPRIEPGTHFRFETDATGVFRWVDGVNRAAVIGLSLALPAADKDESRIDGVAAGAFRRRAGFINARLTVEGESDAAGDWLMSAVPAFDPANGRFTGYRGTARRPRADERADPVRESAPIPADLLRQLMHELRTPTNAIAGFAEMIQSQMLGPVSDPYRERAGTIRAQARELLGAIDDLDLAARIDSSALALTPGRVALGPVLAIIADDLAALAELRGSTLALPIDDFAVTGDRRAVERLLARLLATLVSASGEGERIGVRLAQVDGAVRIAIDRPRALADYPGDAVLGIDDEREDMTLLGTGFALRLARNLARELGGALVIGPERLTLRLPGSDTASVGQAQLS